MNTASPSEEKANQPDEQVFDHDELTTQEVARQHEPVFEEVDEVEDIEDAQIIPADTSTPPINDDSYIRFGTIFLMATLGLFTLWATFAPLSSAVIAMGEVVVNSHRKSIQHFEGGVIQQIFVRNGDKVSEGDLLIQLETTQASSKKQGYIKRLFTAKAELERLMAEQSFQTSLIYSDELLAQAEKDKDVQQALVQQSQLFEARVAAFTQESEALRSRIDQIQQQIQGLVEQQEIARQQIASIKEEHNGYETLFEEGLGDGLKARELSRLVLSKQNESVSIKSEIARLKIQMAETELHVATRKQDFLKEVGERIKQVQDDYYANEEGLQITNDIIERASIRAPEDGIVVDMQVHTVGSVAPAGRTLLDLVPEDDIYVVESEVLPRDINDVYVGQPADIRFSAFNAKTTKIITGEVITVSADRLIDEQDGSSYYLARIRITDEGAKDLGDNELKPGMPAEVMIVREDRTLMSYLFKPLSDSFARSLKES